MLLKGIGLLFTILAFWVAYRKLLKQIKKPKIQIEEISAKPWISDEGGGFSSSCFIIARITNPSNENNEVDISVVDPGTAVILTRKNQVSLPALKSTLVRIEFDYQKYNSAKSLENILGQKILIKLCDVHGRKVRHRFIFHNIP